MVYHIRVKGKLDESWPAWLGNVEIVTELEEDGVWITVLTVDVVDQPALFGILDRIRDLNLFLFSVSLDGETTSPPGEGQPRPTLRLVLDRFDGAQVGADREPGVGH
jgi:hypothetical protein